MVVAEATAALYASCKQREQIFKRWAERPIPFAGDAT